MELNAKSDKKGTKCLNKLLSSLKYSRHGAEGANIVPKLCMLKFGVSVCETAFNSEEKSRSQRWVAEDRKTQRYNGFQREI